MGRQSKINLVLLALVAALAAAVWLLPQPGQDTAVAVSALDKQQVKRIRISRSAGAEIVLERQGQKWRLLDPFPARANSFRIDNLLAIAASTSEVQLPAQELARYGLEPPAVTLWLDDDAFAFGDTNPVSRRRYLRHGDSIYLVTDSAFRHVSGSASEFADPQVLGGIEPTAFELPGLRLTLTENGWSPDPAQPQVPADRITALVDEWRYARALDLHYREQASGGERLRIRHQGENGEQWLEIRVLERKPDLILYRPDEHLAYRLPADAAQRLFELQQGENAGTAGG